MNQAAQDNRKSNPAKVCICRADRKLTSRRLVKGCVEQAGAMEIHPPGAEQLMARDGNRYGWSLIGGGDGFLFTRIHKVSEIP